jgi:D-aminopeptidase
MARASELPVRIGGLPRGATGSIHDVSGVGLGHFTLVLDEHEPPAGRGTVRTGVSVLHLEGDGFASPVPAGAAVLNGAGECTGLITVQEWGLIETPVFLTSTMQVGRVYDAACLLLAERDPRIGVEDVVIPVVAECDDSGLSDPRRARLTDADVAHAWDAAIAASEWSGTPGAQAPDEGSVGAGTGMECLGWKGGIGTASRVLPSGYTLGALVLANFGDLPRLTIAGVPVGELLAGESGESGGRAGRDRGAVGSGVVVLVTDAPIDAHGCRRLAARAGLGLARVGSTGSHGSGEIFLALATGLRSGRSRGHAGPAHPESLVGQELDPFFEAAVDATEEAVVTTLLAATDVTGRDGFTVRALPLDAVLPLLASRR